MRSPQSAHSVNLTDEEASQVDRVSALAGSPMHTRNDGVCRIHPSRGPPKPKTQTPKVGPKPKTLNPDPPPPPPLSLQSTPARPPARRPGHARAPRLYAGFWRDPAGASPDQPARAQTGGGESRSAAAFSAKRPTPVRGRMAARWPGQDSMAARKPVRERAPRRS